MDPRFSRNIPGLTEAEQTLLGQKRVLVAGCGGLGGYLIELLTRAVMAPTPARVSSSMR